MNVARKATPERATAEARARLRDVIEIVSKMSEGPGVPTELEQALAAALASADAAATAVEREVVALGVEAARAVERAAIERARADRFSEHATSLSNALESERRKRIAAEAKIRTAREWMKHKRVDFANAELAGEEDAA